jgi:hypothetical protein
MLSETTTLLLTIIDILLFFLAYMIMCGLASILILKPEEYKVPKMMVLKYTLICILVTPILGLILLRNPLRDLETRKK